ncbi:hypothetical protein ACFPRL_19640 [Pseudoclavibacter helvolus]
MVGGDIHGVADALHDGEVAAATDDGGGRKGRADGIGEDARGQLAAHERRVADHRHLGCGPCRQGALELGGQLFGGEQLRAAEQAEGRRRAAGEVGVVVDGEARGVGSAVDHLAQHGREQVAHLRPELGVAQLQRGDSTHGRGPFEVELVVLQRARG